MANTPIPAILPTPILEEILEKMAHSLIEPTADLLDFLSETSGETKASIREKFSAYLQSTMDIFAENHNVKSTPRRF